jgi:hypothetical protein
MANNNNVKEKNLGGRPIEYDIEGVLQRADFEISRLKKVQDVSYKSQYKKYGDAIKSKYHNLNQEAKCGFEFNMFDDPTYLGSMPEWRKAFKRFAKKKVNIYGQKVDRSALLNEDFKFGDGGGSKCQG